MCNNSAISLPVLPSAIRNNTSFSLVLNVELPNLEQRIGQVSTDEFITVLNPDSDNNLYLCRITTTL